MNKQQLLFGLACVTYAVAAFVLFPRFNSNVLFGSVVLLAAGSWLYGRTIGLLLLLPTLTHQFLIYQHFANSYVYYTDRIAGTALLVTVVFIVGTQRNNLRAIQETTNWLDETVAKRNATLEKMTRRLIQRAEARRTAHGRDLHDSIGQQLTGIQLYATSLSEQLNADHNPGAAPAHSLTTRARTVHNNIRQTARLLFPVQLETIGLHSALDELEACIQTLRNTRISIKIEGDLASLPPNKALQIYRICQETALLITQECVPQTIDMALKHDSDRIDIQVAHDGPPLAGAIGDSLEAQLIKYRLNMLAGHIDGLPSQHWRSAFHFGIPLETEGHAT
ncbi:sensor histidine kinase [Pontiella sp.]|uniref:sensor histidine kinase n=1 Tax=Pontiella sp. TaxID=2837462 RepID=UPI003568D439